jgi:cobalt-zinc-cadmium efflux system membrane fusion protein
MIKRNLPSALLALYISVAVASCSPGTADTEPEAVAEPDNESAATVDDWCAGHGLPESKCTICNPELIEGFKAAADWCAEHGLPESACPQCNPVAPPPGDGPAEIAPGTRIRFKSPEIERASGIATERARPGGLEVDIECTAHIDFDRNRLADIRASVPGVVREVKIDLGDRVDERAELFAVESPEIGDLQARLRAAREHLQIARAFYDRQLELRAQEIVSDRQVELAREGLETEEAELRSIEVGLRIAGAGESSLDGTLRVRSPIAGTVVRRPATLGTFATSDVSLATIADTSRMWALLEVREADAGALRVGQPVTIRVDGLPGRPFTGTVTWIASEVDPRTRTVAARAEVENDGDLLRAEQFARAAIRVAESDDALVIPQEAVQRIGEESVIFVRTGEGLYEPRTVFPGRSSTRLIEVHGALREGESVVTEGAFLLKTELSREDIGAGCCEVTIPDES